MTFYRLKGYLAGVALATLCATPAAVSADEHMKPGAGTTVKMARATWDTGWFQAHVYKQLLQELGYEVPRLISLKNPAFYTSVSRGDVDLWTNGWFPLHNTYKEDFKKGARKIGYVAKGGAMQGYMVSKKHAEKWNITSLEDFKRDKVKKAFDQDGDGKAEMVACPPGWGCEKTISKHWDAYNMRKHVDLIKADYSPSMADALARFKNGEPVFFYTWTPNWTVNVFRPGKDVMWVTVPRTVGTDPSKTTVKGMETCMEDPCNLGWVANDIRPVANKEFLKNNVAATVLLEEARIPLSDIAEQNRMMQKGEDSKEDLQRHAEEWIEENRSKVDKWLQEARDAASS